MNDHGTISLKRLAIIFHRIGPYHFARARAVGKVSKTRLIEIFKSDDTYKWDLVSGADGFDRVTLFENSSQPSGKLVRGIQNALDECKPDAVAIPGWADAVAFAAIEWCGANGIPVIVMSETTEWDTSRRAWKEWVKRRILKICSAGLVGGRPHAEYLARLGMTPGRIFLGYDAVDNDYFARSAKEARSQESEVRRKYGLPENYFLASARFVQKKNLFNLVRAYARYRELAEKAWKGGQGEGRGEREEGSRNFALWSLVLLGDGDLKFDLDRMVASLGLQEFVLMPGFKQYDELPAFYALAKAFIHASTVEQWGLVVNEAMASGLPVLVSNRCGCARDLVEEGVNGFTFDPYNVGQMAETMVRISDSEFPLSEFGAASARVIANWCPERFANGLSKAVEAALAAPRVKVGAFDRLLLNVLSRR